MNALWGVVCTVFATVAHAAAPSPYAKAGDEVVNSVRTRFFDAKKAEAWAAKHQGYGAAASSAEDFARRTNEALAELGASHTVLYPRGGVGDMALSAIFQEFLRLPRVEHASIGADIAETPAGFFVRHVFAGGPAAKAGVLRGDRIVSVEGKPFRPGTSFNGRDGRATRLSLERTQGAALLTFTVTPRKVNPRREWLEVQRGSSRIVDRGGQRVAYQHLYSCAGTEHQEALRMALTETFMSADALVIDFRDGWGGCNTEFLDLFNPLVPFFTGIDRGGRRNTRATTWRKPVVLLVNGNSRSGKEMVAFAFKKHKRGTLVGQRTAGAVLAGAPIRLSSGDLLYLAVSDVEVDGVRLEGSGVAVDVEVPDALPYAAGKDPQLDKALGVAASAVGRR
ncbi:PDZ domain-containing protein [Pyxidicoccus fallax]|uniref:PDZ domain-containing protein n=1 Tax=Pyxidicoccus fallax TaxID=394095 RepID=A0A848LBP9_9BACT|nr:S41 family peptidase [Pyxidicoccus fallax]NMO16087.1 PDZ domain-containing protein [Pyxidicoccus fallax]NPC84148.1 PDZ domain-containing protein [Pyxidicoccus fallax]